MQLTVLNIPQYLSPSSFKEWNLCQMKFFLKRMAGLPFPDFYQNLAAAIGCSFDALVKHELAARLNLGGNPDFSFKELFNNSVEPQNRTEALFIAEKLFNEYTSNGCIDTLMNEGLSTVSLADTKLITADSYSVPTRYIPDCALVDGTIIDFKVQGAASKTGTSPNPGYVRSICNRIDKFAHPKYNDPLELLNREWAEQLTIYSWGHNGPLPWRDIKVGIENITVRGDKITCSSIRTIVTKQFQIDLWEKYKFVWDNIINGKINDPSPNEGICFNYRTRCEVSEHCDAFKRWQVQKASDDPLSNLR